MKKIVLFILLSTILTGCSFFSPHKMDIEQGNIITNREVDRLKVGMTESQVRNVMGNPLLINIFTPDRLDYVYTFQAGGREMQETRVICLFHHGILQKIITE